jgi:hypothetical protein
VLPSVAKVLGTATDVGIRPLPPFSTLVTRLLKVAPGEARCAFDTLARLETDLLEATPDAYSRLKATAFLPVYDPSTNQWRRVKPGETCFLDDTGFHSALHGLLPSVAPHSFLRSCGVREQPGPVDIATLLATSPGDVFKALGEEGYKRELESLARHISSAREITPDLTAALQAMSRGPCLLAVHKTPQAPANALPRLGFAPASKIVILDDLSVEPFDLWRCPEDEQLIRLYRHLGCNDVSKEIKVVRTVINGPVVADQGSEDIRNRIRERRAVLIMEWGEVFRVCT